MSGLLKAKKYDWKDSNMALFGSDTEKQVKKESAQSEPAWKSAGNSLGLQIWRVVKFKIESWPKEDYGKFYEGDSYILLNTYKNEGEDEIQFDVHFWIGKYSTQDEYGTAAYKTVELDTFLDDKPVQHREVQNHESSMFKSYFTEISYLKGGADTGFRKVKPIEYKPRLLQVFGERKNTTVKELAMKEGNITPDDVFIVDKGLEIYVLKGKNCNKDESYKAAQVVNSLRSERGGKPKVETFDEDIDASALFSRLGLEQDEDDDDDDSALDDDENKIAELHLLSDNDGSLDMEKVKEGRITMEDFKSGDVFLFDQKSEVFVWIGKKASEAERKNALTYAHNYLMKSSHPLSPVSVISEGRENKVFRNAVANAA